MPVIVAIVVALTGGFSGGDDGGGGSSGPARSVPSGLPPGFHPPEGERGKQGHKEGGSRKDPASSSNTVEVSPSSDCKGYSAEECGAIAQVLGLIDAGASSRYSQDGSTFQNREGQLPDQPLGYYREYTVETPGSPDRGARRLVIGEAGDSWYTSDHYASFERIDPEDFK